MKRKVTAVYYSATGNSKTSACVIARELSEEFNRLDVTMEGFDFGKKEFTEKDVLVISAPVYGGRIFKGAMKRFLSLHGAKTPCIVTVTYGNRHYDDALLELKETMQKQGFIPIAAAALVGEHTYGSIQVGRPDEKDQKENAAFARQVKDILSSDLELSEVAVPGNHPYREGGDGGKFRPQTNADCTQCGLCAEKCPQGAIGKDCRTIDEERCIACFRCIRICPLKAKNMDGDSAYQEFARNFTQKLSVRRENAYFIKPSLYVTRVE